MYLGGLVYVDVPAVTQLFAQVIPAGFQVATGDILLSFRTRIRSDCDCSFGHGFGCGLAGN
jgi:hypothetical protein